MAAAVVTKDTAVHLRAIHAVVPPRWCMVVAEVVVIWDGEHPHRLLQPHKRESRDLFRLQRVRRKVGVFFFVYIFWFFVAFYKKIFCHIVFV